VTLIRFPLAGCFRHRSYDIFICSYCYTVVPFRFAFLTVLLEFPFNRETEEPQKIAARMKADVAKILLSITNRSLDQ
jgi:hypothetical protein